MARLWKIMLAGLVLAAVAVAGICAVLFRGDMAAARARIDPSLSQIIETRHGALEYAERGNGLPILFLHGTGGGFDQGLAMSASFLGEDWRIIAPSRFGYLRSSFPETPGPMEQAEVLADLLDHLGLDKVAVVGGSAGAIPAIAFAAKYPERTSALVALVPAVYSGSGPDTDPWGPVQRRVAEAALGSDVLFWLSMRLAEDTLTGALLATDADLVHKAPTDEQARVRDVLYGILPISERIRGLLNDAGETSRPSNLPFGEIEVPTLAVSLEDDRFSTAANARMLADRIPGARAVIYPEGGHVWVGREAEVFAEIARFLREAAQW